MRKSALKIIKPTAILPMDHSLQMQEFQAADNFSDVESKTVKNENNTIMRPFSVIRSEAISVNRGYNFERQMPVTIQRPVIKQTVSNTAISPRILCMEGSLKMQSSFPHTFGAYDDK